MLIKIFNLDLKPDFGAQEMAINDKECEEKWQKNIGSSEKNHKDLITKCLQTQISLGCEQN